MSRGLIVVTGACMGAVTMLLGGIAVYAQGVPSHMFNDMRWRLIGPFRAGRAVAVGGVPGDPTTFYFGAVDGGVWKTTDAGTVWKPIFDKQHVASIGALAVSPSDPKVIYVGTGESDIRSDLASGDGMYKSTDGGESWRQIGLEQTRQISKVVIDPSDPNTVYVGALGHAYGPNRERGVYKSTDGGVTWKQVLYKGPDLGAADLAIATAEPKRLFAALWNAHRPPWSTYAPLAGAGSGLYRSVDAGESWQECTGHGLPDGPWGRAGVGVSADGRRVYALIAAGKSGLYVSDDGGDTWRLQNADARLTSRAWYFNRITVDPENADAIYVPNVALLGSHDGGKTIEIVRGAPGGDDYHELWVDPKSSSRMVLGTDQGTTISLDGAKSWTSWYNQPTAQMYHVTTDNLFPYTVYGSQQDSGGAAEPSRTDHGQIAPRDWFPASGSESGYVAVDPKDPQILYVSGGYGTVVRFDRRRSLSQDITPWPVPVFGSEIAARKYRDPWTPPLVFSPVDASALYLGTQYVMKTVDGGLHWTEISPDLTGSTAGRPLMAGVIANAAAASQHNSIGANDSKEAPTIDNAVRGGYGTLATVAPSYIDKNVLWAGSDTSIISITRDGGVSWANVTPPALQPWSRIALIEPSHFEAGIAYAAVERHRMDDQAPYLYRTRDYGRTWQAIASGIDAKSFVNAVREDPERQGLLYAGTEFGVYVSFDNGDRWQPLQLNLPVTSVRDLAVHGDDLVVATHGRSFWILDNVTPLRQASDARRKEAFLYKPETVVRVDNDGFLGTPLPPEEPTAENPPNGAVLDYYLPVAAEKVELHIYTNEHTLVRHFASGEEKERAGEPRHKALPIAERWFPPPPQLNRSSGMHRFVWNLAWGTAGMEESDEPDDGNGDVPRGPRIAPGKYIVELRVNGKRVGAETLTVTMDPRSTAGSVDLQQQFEVSYKIFKDSLESRRALAEMASVTEQVAKVNNGLAGKQAAELEARVRDITSGASNGAESTMGLEQANAELTAALNVAESSDRAMPSQALAVYAEAHTGALTGIERWSALKKGELAELNRRLHEEGQAPIAVSEIEREVEWLMTR